MPQVSDKVDALLKSTSLEEMRQNMDLDWKSRLAMVCQAEGMMQQIRAGHTGGQQFIPYITSSHANNSAVAVSYHLTGGAAPAIQVRSTTGYVKYVSEDGTVSTLQGTGDPNTNIQLYPPVLSGITRMQVRSLSIRSYNASNAISGDITYLKIPNIDVYHLSVPPTLAYLETGLYIGYSLDLAHLSNLTDLRIKGRGIYGGPVRELTLPAGAALTFLSITTGVAAEQVDLSPFGDTLETLGLEDMHNLRAVTWPATFANPAVKIFLGGTLTSPNTYLSPPERINEFFSTFPTVASGTVYPGGASFIDGVDNTILTAKGYTVLG